MAGVYWTGQDGNVYIKRDGVTGVAKVSGAEFEQVQRLGLPVYNGLTMINDPVEAQRQQQANTQTQATTSLSGGGGGGTAAPTVDPALMAYYDDQESRARSGIDRLGNQLNIGLENITNSWQEALNRLTGQKATADRDLGMSREETTTTNRNQRADIDKNVAGASRGIQRVLGSIGAGRSSAAQILSPFAIARQGTAQQRQAQDVYGRNMQKYQIAEEDMGREFESNKGALETNKAQKERELRSGLAQQEAQFNESLSNIALQRAQAKGQDYGTARAAMTPFSNRVNELLGMVDNFGRQYQGAVQPVGDLKFNAPQLEQFDRANIKVSADTGNNPVQQVANSYYNMILNARKKNQNQVLF